MSKGGIERWSAAPDGGYLGARWSPDGTPTATERAINAQPHHHWHSVIDPGGGRRRERYDSVEHFLDFTSVSVDRSGPIGRTPPGGWRPDWCRGAPRA